MARLNQYDVYKMTFADTPAIDAFSRLAPGFAVDGTADVIVLAVQNLTAAAETYFASLSINEVS